jgi:hypothetical protein
MRCNDVSKINADKIDDDDIMISVPRREQIQHRIAFIYENRSSA